MRYSRFIGQISAKRQPSIIRECLKILSTASADMIPLAGGLPNPSMFPFASAEFKLHDGTTIDLKGKTMDEALQYLPTNGHLGLLSTLRQLQMDVHGLKENAFEKYDLVTTSGSQSGLSKSLEMLINDGDSVCLGDHTYFASMSILNPYNAKYVKVQTDGEGLRPDSLWAALSSRWSPGDPGAPKFIYTNPTGANPCGSVLPLARKREIYDICSTYDMIILEDDPYYFMQFDDRREPSFLSIDSDCRVIRFDSFSKVLSAGLRLGFLTGPKPLVDRLVLHMQVSELHASSMSQVLVNELLKSWGKEGFFGHVNKLEEFYKRRRDRMNAAAERHLSGLCEWTLPRAGMFMWIKVKGVEDTWDMIMDRGLKRNVMLVPGRVFVPAEKAKSPYLRASYSLAQEDRFDEGFKRLALLIREEQQKQGHVVIEEARTAEI